MARYESYGQLDSQYIDEIDSNFVGFNNRSRPDSLSPGILQESKNFRFQREGVAERRASIAVQSAPLTLDANNAFTLPFHVYADDTASGVSVSTDTITFSGVDTEAGSCTSGCKIVDQTLVNVRGITATNYTDGENHKATRVSATSISINVPGVTGPVGGTAIIGAPALKSSFVTNVYGSCLFEDPLNEGEPYIIIAGNNKAVAVKLSDNTTTDITYDSGSIQLGESVELLQAFNRVFIFRNGLTALEWNGVLTGSPNFTKVSNGAFTQPILLSASNNTVIADNKVSVTDNGDGSGHGLTTGDPVVVIDKGTTDLTDGSEFIVTVVDADEFFFYTNVDDASATSVKYSRRASRGGGYIHMPAAPFGVFHQERMVVPFTFDSASTPASRGVIDEILFSEPGFSDIYDPVFATSRLTQGGADRVVGLFSFTEDKLLVFMRDSIYLFSGTTGSIGSANKALLTQEVGLLARRSVVQVGNQVLFLSDNGVYGLSFQDLYNLRGNDKPLSEPIQASIDDINKEFAKNAVAVYFDNRYYIAVPTGTSQVNDKILIFNFLNGQWESVDSVGETDNGGQDVNWDINNLIVAGDGDKRAVYAVNRLGGVHKLDASTTTAFDQVITQIGGSVQSVLSPSGIKTRQYNFRGIDRKKWNSFEVQYGTSDMEDADANVIFNLENIDATIDAGNLNSYRSSSERLGQNSDVSIRGRIGNARAYGCDVQIDGLYGIYKIKAIKVSGGIAFKSQQSAE
jgi:hypothetical protein